MNAVNTSFVMLCALLVLLMTPALGMFYSGMVRTKNSLNTIMNCFIVFGVITLQWVIIGFSLAFGQDSGYGIVGNFSNFVLEGISGYNDAGVPNILFVTFQMMFALIASAIITGSLVGRVKLGVLVIFLIVWSTFVYDVLAHMIWSSDGFLLNRGGLDFAGGGVVHISSGVAGLVAITPACGYVGIWQSIVIGGFGAMLCYMGLSYIKYKLKWDDSLDAFSLHGIGGVWGGIATGLFADSRINPLIKGENSAGDGLFVSGSFHLLLEQCLGIVICIGLSAVVSFVIFKIISLFTTLRVEDSAEEMGLDVALHGEEAYNLN